ncbi:MAG: HEAT repeat domain-containing protein [bacterium]
MNLKHLGAWTAAAFALLGASPGRPATLGEALARLTSDDVLVADAAVEEIVAFGAPAVDSLLPRLSDPGRDVRAGAIRGLGLLGDRRAAPALREMLGASLDHAGPDTMESRYLRILLIQAVGRLKDPDAAALLRKAAASSDPFERTHAALSLVVSAQDPGYDLVRECVADHDPAIRALAAEGLGETSDGRAKALLLDLTRDEAWVVRDSAYRSLGRFGGDAAVREALERGSHDPSWYVRQTVAEAAAAGRR